VARWRSVDQRTSRASPREDRSLIRASTLLRRFALVLCASAALLVAGRATAQPARKGARVTWVRGIGAERCIGRLGLEEDVKARLGYDPFTLPSDVAIEGAVVRATPGFRAELVVRDPRGVLLGTRQLTSRESDCRSLGEAIAVAVTVAIDPDAPGARIAPVEEVPPNAPLDRVPPPPSAAPATDRVRGRASATIGASAGILPGLSLVTALRARAELTPVFEIGLGGHFWPETREGGLGFSLVSGSLDACVAPLSGIRALRWCAYLHAGAFHAFVHSAELVPVEVGMFPWLAGETGPAVSIAIVPALRIEAGVSAVVPVLRRQAFVRGRADPVWEQEAVAGRADIGLAAVF
jgi:hypothetical protein